MLLSLNALLIVSILSMWWLKQRQFRCTHVSGVAMLYGEYGSLSSSVSSKSCKLSFRNVYNCGYLGG